MQEIWITSESAEKQSRIRFARTTGSSDIDYKTNIFHTFK